MRDDDDDSARQRALLRLARCALEGAPSDTLTAEATAALSHRLVAGSAARLAAALTSAATTPDAPPPALEDSVLDELVELVRTAARRAQSDRFRQALVAARAGAWEWNMRTGEVFWSEENFRLMGLEPSDERAHYHQWLERVHPEDRGGAERAVARAVRERTDLDIVFRIVRPDGEVRWIRDVGETVCDDRGEPIAMYGIQLDITESKRAELAHAEAEARLQQTQRMEALGRLAGGIAHDFNNLLTVMLTAGHMVVEAIPPGHGAREQAEAIREAAERGAALTSQLLAMSRNQPVEPQPVDLDAQIQAMVPMLRRLVRENIEIDLELHGNLPSVCLDPGQLDQVLLNLAVNACDAMPRGGRLAFRTDVEPGEVATQVVLAVSDTGTGMDAATVARAFEPFFTTKPEGRGTGLGLATVYGIVAQNHGAIHLDSAPGAGTRFLLRFPAYGRGDAARAVEEPRVRRSEGGARILIVEDEAALRHVVAAILEDAGYRVVAAANEAQALALVEDEREPLDLVLSDVVLPGASGPDIAHALRQRIPGLRVLFMSGYLGDRLEGLGESAGVLEKPFSPAVLLDAVQRALR